MNPFSERKVPFIGSLVDYCELDNLRRGAGLAQAGKDARDAVVVSVCVHVRHGVYCKSHVEAVLVRMACRRLDSDTGSDSGDHHLGDAQVFEVLLQAGVGKCSPRPFGHRMVGRLLVQLRDQIGPSGREVSATPRLFRSAGRSTVNVDQHHRQSVPAECVS